MFNEKAKLEAFAKELVSKGVTKAQLKAELTKYIRSLSPSKQAKLAIEIAKG